MNNGNQRILLNNHKNPKPKPTRQKPNSKLSDSLFPTGKA